MKIACVIALLFSASAVVSQSEATIAGRLINRDGSPAANIRVMAVAAQDSSAQAGREIVSFAQTDAAGNYQLESVPPGRYFVTAGIVGSQSYYPGVADSTRATVVTVTAGTSLRGVDFLQVASQKISGRVILLPNSPPLRDGRGVQIRLMAANGLAQFAKIESDGTFQFQAVSRGNYDAMVNPGMNMIPVRIVVEDKDITGIELAVPPTKGIPGKVIIEGEGRVTRLYFAVGSFAVDGPVAGLNLLDGSSFQLALPEGEFPIALSSTMLSGYTVKTFTYGSVDLLKDPLKVTPSGSDQLRIVLVPKDSLSSK
jgi:Carboxypeptidase regulatory-like domain